MRYTPIIGLETHVELKTNSKMFCACSADYFGKEPNTHTCPVCLGLPGALPYPNKKAVEWCIMIGLALNCKIPTFSKFDRKNYFYPDLPKGYQISQYDQPFCSNGFLELSSGKKILIRRVHMEEDTGKLIHKEGYSLIDFNRSGVPLVEIVTEPDFESADEVKEYLQKLQKLVRYLGVSSANLERGEMRLEPNISLRKEGQKKLPQYKVEVKNINSFNFVGKAINFEIERQAKLLEEGQIPPQETRGFTEKSNSTVSQRLKEEASDYRYFPDPDIPPLRWTDAYIDSLRKVVEEKGKKSPDNMIKLYLDLGMSMNSGASIAASDYRTDVFNKALSLNMVPLDQRAKFGTFIANQPDNIELSPEELYKRFKESQEKTEVDKGKLDRAIDNVLKNNEKAVTDFKLGQENAIMFLVGQVIRQFKEKVDAEQIKASLLAKLNNNGNS